MQFPSGAGRFAPPCIGISPYSDRLIGGPLLYEKSCVSLALRGEAVGEWMRAIGGDAKRNDGPAGKPFSAKIQQAFFFFSE